MRVRRLLAVVITLAVPAALVGAVGPAGPAQGAPSQNGATVRHASHADTSPPLRDIQPKPFRPGRIVRPEHEPPSAPTGGAPDPVVQSSTTANSASAATLSSFEGLGAGLNGFTVQYAPPDTNGDVGPNHYVQIVNVGLAIFNKTGTIAKGPMPTNTIFSGFGGGCETNNDGDATVKYDRLADRWLISQFSVSTKPYLQCVAVSTSGDPTGTYQRFSFAMGSNFPDYPKLGVWPDGYYTTFNMFSGNRFVGAEVCAYNRDALLHSLDTTLATQVCVSPPGAASLLPADLDGSTPPASGTPIPLLTYGTNSLQLWTLRVDWANLGSSLLGPTSIAVSPFTAACAGGCIPQLGTSQKLDSLSDRLMYRLAYRNLGGTGHLVVSHAVNPGNGTSAVRWYELWNPTGVFTVHQQGTYAPNSSSRWMSSAAMDAAGQIAVGYSISSATMRPAIGYAAHQTGDDPNQLGAETVLMQGTGSQTTNLARWGDYSSMSVDPTDDCTFWYTNEYLAVNGTWNWHTWIGSFRLPNCAATAPADFAVSVAPSTLTVAQGSTAGYTVTVSPASTYSGTVTLSSAAGSLSPTSLTFTAPGASAKTATLTIDTAGMSGTTSFDVLAAAGSITHTASASLTVTPAAAGDFAFSAKPSSRQVNGGRSVSYTITVTSTNGFTGTVDLAVDNPTNTAAAASPTSVSLASGGSATAILGASASAPGTYTITVTATSTGLSHTQAVTLVRR